MKDVVENRNKLIYYFMIFILGAFVGYLYEVIFYYINLGFFNNWGIMYGPWLPIYGIGAVFLSFFKVFKKKPVLLFLSSIVITGLVEYIIGYIAFNVLNLRLWDYRGLFLNIKGLVCFRSVITFSIGSLFLIYLFEPIILKLCEKRYIKLIALTVFIIFLVDIVFSVIYRSPYTF